MDGQTDPNYRKASLLKIKYIYYLKIGQKDVGKNYIPLNFAVRQ